MHPCRAVIGWKFNQTARTGQMMTDMLFPTDPGGLYHAIQLMSTLGKPIYITETGLADHTGSKRSQFFKEYFTQVLPFGCLHAPRVETILSPKCCCPVQAAGKCARYQRVPFLSSHCAMLFHKRILLPLPAVAFDRWSARGMHGMLTKPVLPPCDRSKRRWRTGTMCGACCTGRSSTTLSGRTGLATSLGCTSGTRGTRTSSASCCPAAQNWRKSTRCVWAIPQNGLQCFLCGHAKGSLSFDRDHCLAMTHCMVVVCKGSFNVTTDKARG